MVCCFCTSASAAVFSDTNHWAKNYIDYVVEKGYFQGTSPTTFSPDLGLTRGMFVTVLCRYCRVDTSKYDSAPFADVKSTTYYAGAVAWAYEEGIVSGTGCNAAGQPMFSPMSNLTRESMAVILDNFYEYKNSYPSASVATSVYGDDSSISPWARASVYRMQECGMLCGSAGKFCPLNTTNRGESATVLARMDGVSFSAYDTDPEKELLGTFKLTCYCAGCNTPRGSLKTTSGVKAFEGEYGTVAVSSSLYRTLGAGTVLYIEGVGYRTIHDCHGSSDSVIDVFMGDDGCECSHESISNKNAAVYVVK